MESGAMLGVLEGVMRSINVGTLVLDSEQRVVFWNRWIEKHAVQTTLAVGQDFATVFPDMVKGRTHAAIREALERNFPSLISQSFNKAPFPLFASPTDVQSGERMQQAVHVIPIEIAGLPRHCLVQIIDVSKAVMREKLLREQSDTLKTLSYTDALTGIANRRHFDKRITEEFARARRPAVPLSLLIIDIDYFKAYNDHYGHPRGDNCLREVATTLAGIIKRPADIVARYGGEEFAALLPDTDAAGALHLANAMINAIRERGFVHGHSAIAPHVTVSIGVATHIPVNGDTVMMLVDAADQGLYEAKRTGRNRAVAWQVLSGH